MGSLEAACIAGFLCRLCSEIHRTVIHIYSDQGLKHGLAKKINDYLPVTVCIYVLPAQHSPYQKCLCIAIHFPNTDNTERPIAKNNMRNMYDAC